MKEIKMDPDGARTENFTGIVTFDKGNKIWYKNGHLHRKNGPAVKWLNNVND